jgi:beta-glucosidase
VETCDVLLEYGGAVGQHQDVLRIVDDQERLEFIDVHLRAIKDAIDEGADVRGYFAWSLLDNFEWEHGYAKRFGIVRVDYDTQERTPKASARWYADTIRAHQK